jgi:hypothetical protein
MLAGIHVGIRRIACWVRVTRLGRLFGSGFLLIVSAAL